MKKIDPPLWFLLRATVMQVSTSKQHSLPFSKITLQQLMPTEIENTSQLHFNQKLYVWSPDHLFKPQHKSMKRPKNLQANLLISCSILKVLTYANRNKISKSFLCRCSYRVDLIRTALRAVSQSLPLLLEADHARTELLTSKRFVIGSGNNNNFHCQCLCRQLWFHFYFCISV